MPAYDRILRRGAALASVAVLAACAGGQSTGTSAPLTTPSTASPSGVGLTEAFTSQLHGYSVMYPDGWSVTPATEPWASGAPPNVWGAPTLDDLHGSTVRLVAASQPLAAGQTEDSWLTTYASQGACEGSDPTAWPTISVGGHDGVMSADGCEAMGGTIVAGGLLFDVVVFVDSRAYNFTIDGDTDRAFVEAILATVTF